MELTGEFAGDGARVSGRREAELHACSERETRTSQKLSCCVGAPPLGLTSQIGAAEDEFFVAHPPSLSADCFGAPEGAAKRPQRIKGGANYPK